jgi:segregation and condensation protein A
MASMPDPRENDVSSTATITTLPRQEDYTVALDMFHGPLDLLLYLIRRAEVDIMEIPLAEIIDQYLAFLRQIDDVDVELAGEFLVVAATLIEMKSRTLSPRTREGDDDGEAQGGTAADVAPSDPGYELIQQLLAFQRFRTAAEEMDRHRITFSQRFASLPPRAQRDRIAKAAQGEMTDEQIAEMVEYELEDVHLLDLSEAYEAIASSIDFSRLGDHHVEMDDTPIALYQEDLVDRLTRAESHALTLQQAFEGATRVERIGLFLATLELVRLRRVTVVQESIDSAISLTLNEDALPMDGGEASSGDVADATDDDSEA